MPKNAVDRRTLLSSALAGAAGLALAGTPHGVAAAAAGNRVAVLGGGIAGLTAAHELIERGFEVDVYERNVLGGKARSIPSGRPGTAGRKPLPGEHGYRFYPGMYRNVPETMRRIPFPGNRNGVYDNLVSAAALTFSGPEYSVNLPYGYTQESFQTFTGKEIIDTMASSFRILDGLIPPAEILTFARRMAVFLTSCDQRRDQQWDHVGWIDFIQAQGKSPLYTQMLGTSVTRHTVAAKQTIASARTVGLVADAFLAVLMNPRLDEAAFRVLNGPTSEVWIEPWAAYLRDRGVRFHMQAEVAALNVAHGRIANVTVRENGEHRIADADWFVAAVPVERMVPMLSADILALDPTLAGMKSLITDWMVGIQFFLTDAPIIKGPISFIESPWALAGYRQGPHWRSDISREYGDGRVRDIFSCDISDFERPGILFGKPARDCTHDEIQAEVLAQIRRSVAKFYPEFLRDSSIHSWFLDPGLVWSTELGRNTNETPLLINSVGSWAKRPNPWTAIPNLFLAGDVVRNDMDLATMEGANASARAAVNALLRACGSNAESVTVFPTIRTDFAVAKELDRQRFGAGLPNLLDVP